MWDLKKFISNTVFVDEKRTITYEQLENEIGEIKKVISERCLVFLLCTNQVGSMIQYVACIHNKVVPVLLDVKLDMDLLNNLINEYRPTYIIAPNNYHRIDLYSKVYADKFEYKILQRKDKAICQLHSDLGLLLTTSGSTGSSKLVRLSYQNLFSNAKAISEYLQLNKEERPITTMPMYYTYGLSIINSHLLVGATILVTDRSVIQSSFWNFFRKMKATSFGGVPSFYEILYKIGFLEYELPSLRYFTQAGGKLSTNLQKCFADYSKKKEIDFYIMYGQTEATARISYLPPKDVERKSGSIGIAIPGGTLSLVDEEKRAIEKVHVAGELLYHGDNVMMGYANCQQDLILQDENNGVLYTGDIAQRDEEGYYYIIGRKKRFIKLFGKRISLDEVELRIKDKFPEIHCACTGNDEKLIVYLEEENEKEKVIYFLENQINIYEKAIIVNIVSKIPRSKSGKIQYRDL